MKLTIEKGVCPKCNGFKTIDNSSKLGYSKSILSECTCPLCNGEGLIIISTIEEIEKNTKKK